MANGLQRLSAPQAAPSGGVIDRVFGHVSGVVDLVSGLWSHVRSAQDLVPETAQLDCLVLEGSISAAGAVTQPTNVKVPEQYYFDLMGYSTYITEPGLAVANLVLVTFNVTEVGKRNVFGSDQNFAQSQTIFGPTAPIMFPRSLYLFQPGADIKVTFSRSGTWAGAAKAVGVCLIGGLIAPGKVSR